MGLDWMPFREFAGGPEISCSASRIEGTVPWDRGVKSFLNLRGVTDAFLFSFLPHWLIVEVELAVEGLWGEIGSSADLPSAILSPRSKSCSLDELWEAHRASAVS